MPYNEGILTFTAGEDLEARRLVKIDTNETTVPAEVIYADKGDYPIGVTMFKASDGDPVAVKLMCFPGSKEIEAAVQFTTPGAVAYSANDGKISTVSTGAGCALGVVKGVVSGSGSIAELLPYPYVATAAANVSVADNGNHTSEGTVEGCLQEIYAHIDSANVCIPIPLGSLTLEDGTAITKFSDGASPTPGFSQESNKEVVLRWNNHSSHTAVAFSIPLPNDLDDSADVTIHWLAKMSGTTDSPDLVHECYFNAGDTDCAGTDDEIDGGTTLTEYSSTIGSGNVEASPAALTVIFQPKNTEATTDDTLIYSVWVEYTRKLLS